MFRFNRLPPIGNNDSEAATLSTGRYATNLLPESSTNIPELQPNPLPVGNSVDSGAPSVQSENSNAIPSNLLAYCIINRFVFNLFCSFIRRSFSG